MYLITETSLYLFAASEYWPPPLELPPKAINALTLSPFLLQLYRHWQSWHYRQRLFHSYMLQHFYPTHHRIRHLPAQLFCSMKPDIVFCRGYTYNVFYRHTELHQHITVWFTVAIP